MIFEFDAAGNTAQLGFCGGYRLELSPSNTLSIFALPMRYLRISVITQNETPCKVLWDLGFFVFRILFHFFRFFELFFLLRLDSYCDFFTNLHFIGTFMFFFRLKNSSQTCKFIFLYSVGKVRFYPLLAHF